VFDDDADDNADRELLRTLANSGERQWTKTLVPQGKTPYDGER
jgi:hypothetical protein